jgi:hypothetical protein
LSQPLAAAQILLDQILNSNAPPTRQQLSNLSDCLQNTAHILNQIQNLHSYITKPYADGRILDLAKSSRSSLQAASEE